MAAVYTILDSNSRRMVLSIDRPGLNGVQWANTAGYMKVADFQDTGWALLPCGVS